MNYYTAPGIESRLDVINISKYVALEFVTTTTDMKSKSRERVIRDARNMAVYLLYTCTDMTYSAIGDVFNRHHSTILHSVKVAKRWAQFDVWANKFIEDAIEDLGLKYRIMKTNSLTL